MSVEVKTWLTLWTMWVFGYLWIQWEALFLLWVLIVIDTLLGYIDANVKKCFSSTKAYIWLLKKMVLLLIPITFAIAWKIVWQDVSGIVASILWLLAVAQVYSIVAHIYSINTWEKLTEYDAVTVVVKYLWDMIQRWLERLLWPNQK